MTKVPDAVYSVASHWNLAPQELDIVFTLAMRADSARSVDIATRRRPTIGVTAFEFLSELAASNSGTWMEANRDRYVCDLRDPFRRVLEVVAKEYVQELDPGLNVTVKANQVLGLIKKRFPDDEGAYHTHYWGAFSRGRKQQDAQLYVRIDPHGLRTGLYLGSATPQQRATFADLVGAHAQAYWLMLEPLLPHLRFERAQDPQQMMAVHSPDELTAWARTSGALALIREMGRDDPLIGSDELTEVVGSTLRQLYPLAAAAWGEPPSDEETDEAGGLVDVTDATAYLMEDLARETHLPVELLEEWVELLQGPRRQALLNGPPGSGKTHVATRLARLLAGADGEVLTVQFHPAYSYEDFIEGLRPDPSSGSLRYVVRPGVFQEFCERPQGTGGHLRAGLRRGEPS